jgi:hypothetical protein
MFYADTELGPRQSLLPSGTLWARDVVIARVGQQQYHRSELFGVDTAGIADRDGMVRVIRDASEVFDPQSMSSFEGAPITLGHPEGLVDAQSWKDLAVGHVQNVRRDRGHLVADLLVHDARAIDAVRNKGWRAVSAGYDAEYRPNGRELRQVGIRGNHVAILSPEEDARCGDACAIGDQAWPPRKEAIMSRRQRMQVVYDGIDRLYQQWNGTRDQSSVRVDPNFNVGMGLDPGGDVGPSIVARLAYPASALSIGTDGDGNAVIWFHGPIENKLDNGTAAEGRRPLPSAEADILRQRRAVSTGDATLIRQRRDADEARQRAQLRAINIANRKAWGLA